MRRILAVATPLVVAITVFATAEPLDLPEPAQGPPPALADRDNNRLSDGLQATLAAADPGASVDVVVTFTGPGHAAAAQGAFGPFQNRRDFKIINAFAATVTVVQATALAGAAGVFRVEEDFQVLATIFGANLDHGVVDARLDFAVSGGGSGAEDPVGICIIDTGIDRGHMFFDGLDAFGSPVMPAGTNKIEACVSFVSTEPTCDDGHGHGTHVAGLAAGDGMLISGLNLEGVAPRAALYIVKGLNSAGQGADSDLISAIEWCTNQPGVDVISMSIGTLEASDGQDSLSLASNCAVDPNYSNVCGPGFGAPKSVIIAAGNTGPAPETVGSPGAAENAVTVAALANWSRDGGGLSLAPFSARGPTLDSRVKPDISGPGVRMTSALLGSINGISSNSGTSMATPFVAGVAALMFDANPTLTPEQVKTILKDTAQDRFPNGPDGISAQDYEWGAGVVDAYAAVAQASGLAPGTFAPTAFPTYLHQTATVPNNGEWLSDVYTVTQADVDAGIPIAATITIDGVKKCSIGGKRFCELLGAGWVWNPNIDLELLDGATGAPVPANAGDVTQSQCPISGEFCGASRVETVHYMPLAPGTFQFRAFGEGGTIEFELSKGPLDTSGGGGGPPANLAPVADAGVDQTVSDNDSTGSELVGLDGSASSDADGTIASYVWSEGGVTIATGATPTVDLALGVYTITLTVTDDDGDSSSDTVVVTVKAANQDPVADAGADQIVSDFAGDGIEPVGLDGSLSSDPDGTIASYDWSEGGVTIATGATPTVNLGVGVHTITLTVTDNEGASAADTVVVTVEAGNQFPVADAGIDQTVSDTDGDGSELVGLDGSLSFDPDGTIASYDWSEGGATIATGATPTVTLEVGVHTITLAVTDNEGANANDTVVVTVGAGPLVAGPEFRVNDDITFNQGSPNVAVLNDGNFVIVYAGNNADANMHGVVARLYDPAGNPLTDEFIVNSGVVDDQYEPSVSALDDDGFVVTWSSNLQDGSEVGVYGQRFDAVGNPVGAEFRVNTMTQRSQSSSEAAMLTGGGFVVTWNSWRQDGNKLGIYAQRFDDLGAPVGGEFRANMVTSRDQGAPQVAALTDGGFVLVWHSDRQDGNSFGVFGRRYDSLGNAVADEFRINSFTSRFQGNPHVTALAGNGFAVAWHSDGQDGSGWGVYGQRYDGAGDPAGGEFRVNPDTLNHQAGTRMTTLTDGGFVVAWGAFDGSLWRTFARRYTADGVAMGDKFPISDATNTAGLRPRLASTPDGGFVITWHSPDGDEKGAFARIFAPGTGGGAASVTSLDTPQDSHPGIGLSSRSNESRPPSDQKLAKRKNTTALPSKAVRPPPH